MKISAWVSVSDLVPTRQTLFEKIIDFFDKKHKMYQTIPHEHIFQSLKQAGVNGLELLIPRHTSDKNIAEVKKILNNSDFPVHSVHQPLNTRSGIPLSEIEKLCQIAHVFSAMVIVLHSRTLGKCLFNTEFITQLKKFQKKYQINFGIENMAKNPLISKPFTYRGKDFSSVVTKTGLSITFDTTHLAQAGDDIIQFYLANKKRIVNIHISDYKKNWVNKHLVSQLNSHLALGEGKLPIEKFLATLKREHYVGLVTMEINAGLTKLCNSAKMIKKQIGTL